MYKLAIFDFDGTLVDSAPGIIAVMHEIAGEYGLSSEKLQQWRQLVGIPLPQQISTLFPEETLAFCQEITKRYRDIYDVKVLEICPVFPYLGQMLKQLASFNVLISIVSSKRRYLVEAVLDHHNLANYFSLILGEQEVTYHKPHPESVHYIMRNLSVFHLDTVVIGDSSFDLDMAFNAGVDAIGVTTGIHTKELLQKSSPRFIVNGLQEVLPLILKGNSKSNNVLNAS